MYLGDFAPGQTIHHLFTSIDSDGAPIVLTGSPAVAAYKDASDTQDTDGLSISASVDSVTGLNRLAIDTSADGTFYSAGSSFHIVLTAGTVDGVSVVGYVICSFTLGRSAAYARLGAPAGASISADIAAIESQTDDIGAAGAGLTAIPWNAAWDAQVESEVADALAVYDSPTNAEMVARTLAAADYATAAALTTVDGVADAIKLVTDKLDDTLEDQGGGTFGFTEEALQEAPTGTDLFALATGTAQAGGASSITLESGASATNDNYVRNAIAITGGTGAGQSNLITDYDGTTKVATVAEPWAVVPDNTSVYLVAPFGTTPATIDNIEDAIWDAPRADHQDAGSFGEYVLADATLLFGSSTAAENAKDAFLTAPGAMAVDIQFVNGVELVGDGTDADPWRAIGT